MTLKIDSDDRSAVGLVQHPVDRVARINNVQSVQNRHGNGNGSPEGAEKTDQEVSFPKILGEKDMGNVVEEMNNDVQVIQRELHFSIDKDSGQTVVKVMDLQTKEMIRQIPNAEALKIAQKLSEGVELQLVNEFG